MKTIYTEDAYLMHYGIKGQKKGRRRFQNEDGSLTAAGERRYLKGNDGGARSVSLGTEERTNQIKNAVNQVVAGSANVYNKSAQASAKLAADREAYRQNMIAAKKQRDEYARFNAKRSVAEYRKNAAANTTYGTKVSNYVTGRSTANSPYELIKSGTEQLRYNIKPSMTSFSELSKAGALNRYGSLSDSQRKAIERQQAKKDVKDKVNNFIDNVTTSAKNTASNVVNGVSKAKDNAVGAVKNTTSNIANRISEAKDNAVNAVKNTADSISNKVSETKTDIEDKIFITKIEAKNAFANATNKVKKKLSEAVEAGAEFVYNALNKIESRSSGSNGFEISIGNGRSKTTISVRKTTDITQQGKDFVNSLFGKR